MVFVDNRTRIALNFKTLLTKSQEENDGGQKTRKNTTKKRQNFDLRSICYFDWIQKIFVQRNLRNSRKSRIQHFFHVPK